MKRRENCFGITSSSQFSHHNSAVSVSQPLCQAVSVFQLSHALTVSALPPPIPCSTRVARVCVLVHCNTPEIEKGWIMKGKEKGNDPGRRRQYWFDVKRKVRFPGRVIPWVTPANSGQTFQSKFSN